MRSKLNQHKRYKSLPSNVCIQPSRRIKIEGFPAVWLIVYLHLQLRTMIPYLEFSQLKSHQMITWKINYYFDVLIVFVWSEQSVINYEYSLLCRIYCDLNLGCWQRKVFSHMSEQRICYFSVQCCTDVDWLRKKQGHGNVLLNCFAYRDYLLLLQKVLIQIRKYWCSYKK